MKISLPPGLSHFWGCMKGQGATHLVGGAVRDWLLGREVADFDFATALLPEQVRDLNFGSVVRWSPHALSLSLQLSPELTVDVTTFRRDLPPFKNRHPAQVVPVASFKEDAPRRDYTICALALTYEGEVLDFCGGLKDLLSRTLRLIGDPYTRLQEDSLRALRGLRFALDLDFEFESCTSEALSRLTVDALPLRGHYLVEAQALWSRFSQAKARWGWSWIEAFEEKIKKHHL